MPSSVRASSSKMSLSSSLCLMCTLTHNKVCVNNDIKDIKDTKENKDYIWEEMDQKPEYSTRDHQTPQREILGDRHGKKCCLPLTV